MFVSGVASPVTFHIDSVGLLFLSRKKNAEKKNTSTERTNIELYHVWVLFGINNSLRQMSHWKIEQVTHLTSPLTWLLLSHFLLFCQLIQLSVLLRFSTSRACLLLLPSADWVEMQVQGWNKVLAKTPTHTKSDEVKRIKVVYSIGNEAKK